MMDKTKLFLVLLLSISPSLTVGSTILHAIEYTIYVPVQTAIKPLETPPPTMSNYTDDKGQHHYSATVFLSIQFTDSVGWVKHIYVFGLMADWLEIFDAVDTIRDAYNRIVLVPLLLSLLTYASLWWSHTSKFTSFS